MCFLFFFAARRDQWPFFFLGFAPRNKGFLNILKAHLFFLPRVDVPTDLRSGICGSGAVPLATSPGYFILLFFSK